MNVEGPLGEMKAPCERSPRAHFFAILPSIMFPMFLAVVDQTIVATALPAVAATLGDVEHVSWIVVAYLVAATVAAPVYGRLGDVFGRRRVMCAAIGVVFIASILCATATSVTMLILARVLQGLGGGGLMTTSQALIGETVPPRDRGRFQGYLATVVVTSSMFGPVAGGFLTSSFGWRSVFLVNLPLALLALVLAIRLPSRARETDTPFRFDIVGLVLFVALVVTLLCTLGQILSIDVASLPFWAAGAALWAYGLVRLVRHEAHTRHPLIPVKLLRVGAIWRANALAACHGAALVSLITYLPIYFLVARGASTSESGLLILPLTASLGLGSMITGRLISASGRTAIIATTGLVLTTAALLTLVIVAPYLTTLELTVLLAFQTLSMGTVMAVVQVTVQSSAAPGMLGSAAASVQLSRSIGAAVGTALVGVVLFASLSASDPRTAELYLAVIEEGPTVLHKITLAEQTHFAEAIVNAFRLSFLTIAGFTAAGIVFAWTNPLRRIA